MKSNAIWNLDPPDQINRNTIYYIVCDIAYDMKQKLGLKAYDVLP